MERTIIVRTKEDLECARWLSSTRKTYEDEMIRIRDILRRKNKGNLATFESDLKVDMGDIAYHPHELGWTLILRRDLRIVIELRSGTVRFICDGTDCPVEREDLQAIEDLIHAL